MIAKMRGTVLLIAIGIMVLMGLLGGLLMKQVGSSSELVSSALKYHHASNALASHLLVVEQTLVKEPGYCKQHQYTPEGLWQGIEVVISCALQGDQYVLTGTARAGLPGRVPILVTQVQRLSRV